MSGNQPRYGIRIPRGTAWCVCTKNDIDIGKYGYCGVPEYKGSYHWIPLWNSREAAEKCMIAWGTKENGYRVELYDGEEEASKKYGVKLLSTQPFDSREYWVADTNPEGNKSGSQGPFTYEKCLRLLWYMQKRKEDGLLSPDVEYEIREWHED